MESHLLKQAWQLTLRFNSFRLADGYLLDRPSAAQEASACQPIEARMESHLLKQAWQLTLRFNSFRLADGYLLDRPSAAQEASACQPIEARMENHLPKQAWQLLFHAFLCRPDLSRLDYSISGNNYNRNSC